MAEYHGIILKKQKLPIRHILIYLGSQKTQIVSTLPDNQLFSGFDVINLHEINPEELLGSQIPEVILLAILSNYPKEQSERILRLLFDRLKKASKNPSELDKFKKQLLILSRIRQLNDLTTKIIEEMPIILDMKKDYFYQKGVEEGIEKGSLKKEVEFIISSYHNGISIDLIANITNISVESVKKILSDNGKKL